jgi:antitoxin CcdA
MVTKRRARKPKPANKRPRTKTPTNLSLRTDLVRRARALKLNLSEVVETALEQAIVAREKADWAAENQDAIRGYNEYIAKYGIFGDDVRLF